MRFRKPSPGTAIALIALFFAMGGTAVAAHHYLITSTKQIKPSVLKVLANDKSSDTKLFNSLSAKASVAKAGFAQTAGSATTAGSAASATTAGTANNANNANALSGHPASDFALAAQPGFTAATLEAGFANLGGSFAVASYMKDSLGFVHLRGTMSCPAGEALTFVLPAGYRPAANLFLPLAVGVSGAGNLQVFSTGEVKTFLPGGEPHACGLDGLSFKAEQ